MNKPHPGLSSLAPKISQYLSSLTPKIDLVIQFLIKVGDNFGRNADYATLTTEYNCCRIGLNFYATAVYMKKWIITNKSMNNIEWINDLDEKTLFLKLQNMVDDEKKHWNEDYLASGYESYFSITDCDKVLAKLSERITRSVSTVLIPGCGSKTNLQRYLCDNFPHIKRIYCTDWSEAAINVAKKEFSSDKVLYRIEDTSKMSFQDSFFDLVILANSIVSANDLLNRRMITECYRVLKKGGKLEGLFPTIFSTVEMTMLDPRIDYYIQQNNVIDLQKSLYNISFSKQQIYYTPLRLKQIFDEASFIRDRIEVVFFDSDYFLHENENVYGLPRDSGLIVWELLVSASK